MSAYYRIAVCQTKKDVSLTNHKKKENLSKEKKQTLFNIHDTANFYDIDSTPPKYVIDVLALGPKNPVLDKFNAKKFPAEIGILLPRLRTQNVSNHIINYFKVATLKYVKSCCKQRVPRHLLMTKLTKCYLNENALLAAPFKKRTGMCV